MRVLVAMLILLCLLAPSMAAPPTSAEPYTPPPAADDADPSVATPDATDASGTAGHDTDSSGPGDPATLPIPPAEPEPIFSPPPPAQPQATVSSPLRWTPRPPGQFVYGALLANPGTTAGLAKAAGFSHIWTYVSWKKIEPSRGSFLFKTKDRWGQTTPNDLTNVLTAARRAGLKLALRVTDPPDWAGGKVYRLAPSDVEDYVYEVVRSGQGTISFVEVFNEMNLPREWGTSPTDPAAYVKLLAGAYRGARRADPSVKVVSAGVSARTGGLDGTMEDVDWLDGLYRAGGQASFDLLGMHPYVGSLPPEADPTCTPLCFRTLELWRAVMEKYGDASKQAFITETGTLEQTSTDLGPFGWMELASDKRAEYLVKALQLANANYPWIAGAMVFNLDYATTPWNPASAAHYWFSLLNSDRSPRPAYTLFKQARQNGTLP